MNYELLIIFVLGACVGSFLGVIVDRLPRGESVLKGRSRCDHCKKPLSSLDLIPIFSFVFLGGKCRYCHKRLSYFYPTIELMTGALFVLMFLFLGQAGMNYELGIMNHGLNIVYYLFIVSALIVLFFIDLKYCILPFSIVFPATIITFLYQLLTTNYSLLTFFLSGVGAFAFFLALFLITRGRGMGFGDVVYVFFMGLFLGFPKIILGLYIAFISGAIVALILIFMKKKKLKGSIIAFGPFLVVGTLIAMFWGDKLVSLTINLLGFTIR